MPPILLIAALWGDTTAPLFPEARFRELLHKAEAAKLYEDPQWLKLMHYRKQGNEWESDIDGGYFFLSPEGKHDSYAEMAATLRAFLSEQDLSPPLDKGMALARMHPLCKFRARLHFFRDRIGLQDSMLPNVDCNRFLKWRNALHPSGATLVFASSYLNNPASMFGHTFLRFNSYAGDSGRAILNYGITYGAAVPPNDGLLFVYKGIAGKYHGTFSMDPYYLSVQKYSNLESRDLWEYDLNFNASQMDYLLEHVWEVGACWMHYYFFTENCSYNILTLMEAADPNLQLTGGFYGGIVIPAETLKRILASPNLTGNRKWRPSLLSSFRLKTAALGETNKDFLLRLIHAPEPDIQLVEADARLYQPDTLAAIADATLDYVQYRKRRAKGKKGIFWSDKQGRILKARLALPPALPTRPMQPDDRTFPPEQGHGSPGMAAGAGATDFREFVELGGRLSYHDFNAREAGFLPGSHIECLRFRTRLYYGKIPEGPQPKVELRSLDFLSIQSLTPMDAFQSSLSWAFRAGLETRPGKVPSPGLSLLMEGGGGFAAWWKGPVTAMPFVLAQARIRSVPAAGWRTALGPQTRIGTRFGAGQNHSLLMEYRWFHPVLWGMGSEHDVSLEYRVSLGRQMDARFRILSMEKIGEASLAWNRYF